MLTSHQCLPLAQPLPKKQSTAVLGSAQPSAGRRRMSNARVQPVQATIAAERPASVQRPDKNGRFGKFGGKYVPETLIPALLELEEEYERAKGDVAFQVGAVVGWKQVCVWYTTNLHTTQAELDHLLKHYVGRETPLYYAERLSAYYRQYVGWGGVYNRYLYHPGTQTLSTQA